MNDKDDVKTLGNLFLLLRILCWLEAFFISVVVDKDVIEHC